MSFFETSLFFCLTNPSPDEERDRSRDVCRSIDEEEGDIQWNLPIATSLGAENICL